MISGAGNQPRFLFSLPEFQVLGFSGSEGVNALYNFQLELVTKSTTLDFDALVGTPAQLVILGPGQTRRYINSLIARLELVSTLPQRAIFQAQLVPPHFRLTLKRQLRAFQDLTTQQIVSQVLAESEISKLDWRLRESYKPRNYCAQYRESDLAFISRLLEEEGICYHFEHRETELVTVFSDHNEAFQPISDPGSDGEDQAPQVMFSTITSMVDDQEFVSAFRFRQRLHSGKVQLRDYNFKRPRLDLKGEALGSDETLEVYDFPGEFTDAELGGRLAAARLEELAQQRETGDGSGNCLRFAPGQRFSLGGRGPQQRHPREELNQEYLLLQLAHSGHQGGVLEEEGDYSGTVYGNSFTVQPARVPLRPERTTLRPTSLGTQTATVVGPKGDTIYVDSYGRVKLRFHWDREGKATGWVRVSQAWAGAGFGSQFLPRVGQEVLVSFLEGDPDRPVVIGRVYNGEQVVPFDLPAHKTRSVIRSNSSPAHTGFQEVSSGLIDDYFASPRYNELRFEDAQGHEELFLQAERDYNAVVENDRATLIKRDRHENVRNIQQLKVGRNQLVQVKESSRLRAGTILIEAKEKLTVKVGDSLLELTPASFKLLGSELLGSATGPHDIKGAQVKLNAAPPVSSAGDFKLTEEAFGPQLDYLRNRFTDEGYQAFLALPELSYSPSITIKGDSAFQEMAKNDLDKLQTTPTGKALIASINESGKSVVIMDMKEIGETGNAYAMHDIVNASVGADGKPGAGSNALVFYPEEDLSWGAADWQAMPRDVTLGHELIHADHFVHGTRSTGKVRNDSCPDPSNPGSFAMTNEEEAKTVGFPPYDTQPFTENKLREERSPPPNLLPRLWY